MHNNLYNCKTQVGYHAYNAPAGSEQLCSNHPSSHSHSRPAVKVTGLLPGGILPQINLHVNY